MRDRKGFTLVELLIVVAIMAALAAVAVPNFLEAQTRGKVARVKSDLRTLDAALQAYGVDANTYPPSVSFFEPLPSRRLIPLTTPIAYLTMIPRDPFGRRPGVYERTILGIAPAEPLDLYVYNIGSADVGLGHAATAQTAHQYSLTSGGPDGIIEFPYYAFSPEFVKTGIYTSYVYDPTNGTISRGEIFRRGGYQPTAIPGLNP